MNRIQNTFGLVFSKIDFSFDEFLPQFYMKNSIVNLHNGGGAKRVPGSSIKCLRKKRFSGIIGSQ
jgi:hypothetical protein